MRELKFRAWDIDNKKYEYDIAIRPINRIIDIEIFNNEMYPVEFRGIVEQYTGLKDKNGKEIYEGSMVKSENGQRYGFVEYIEVDGAFMIWWTSENEFIYLGEAIRKYEDLEVIGNVHEGPELLGGKG